MQYDDKPLREIDDTAGSAAEDRFEEIIKRVKESDAEIILDEEIPLYAAVGQDEVEVGEERVVEFNMKGMDFRITRRVKTVRIVGDGHRKSAEEMSRPSIDIQLKRKPDTSDQWVIVDMEEMF